MLPEVERNCFGSFNRQRSDQLHKPETAPCDARIKFKGCWYIEVRQLRSPLSCPCLFVNPNFIFFNFIVNILRGIFYRQCNLQSRSYLKVLYRTSSLSYRRLTLWAKRKSYFYRKRQYGVATSLDITSVLTNHVNNVL